MVAVESVEKQAQWKQTRLLHTKSNEVFSVVYTESRSKFPYSTVNSDLIPGTWYCLSCEVCSGKSDCSRGPLARPMRKELLTPTFTLLWQHQFLCFSSSTIFFQLTIVYHSKYPRPAEVKVGAEVCRHVGPFRRPVRPTFRRT